MLSFFGQTCALSTRRRDSLRRRGSLRRRVSLAEAEQKPTENKTQRRKKRIYLEHEEKGFSGGSRAVANECGGLLPLQEHSVPL